MDNNKTKMEHLFKDYDPDFNPFFETRLMAKLDALKNDVKVLKMYDLFFRRVAVSGILTIAAILVLIFIINGSLSIDSILGVKELSLENSLMLSMTDF